MSTIRQTTLPVRRLLILIALSHWAGSHASGHAMSDHEADGGSLASSGTATSAPIAETTAQRSKWLAEALEAAEKKGDVREQLRLLAEKADMEQRWGMHVDMLETAFVSGELSRSLGDAPLISASLRTLSKAYTVNRRPQQAIESARNALVVLLPSKDQEAIGNAQRFLMHTLAVNMRAHEALALGDELMDKIGADGDELEKARVWALVAMTHLARGRCSDALPYVVKAERIISERGTDEEQAQFRPVRARVRMGVGQLDEAEMVIQEGDHSPTASGDWSERTASDELKYQLAVARSEWRAALELLRDIHARSDSVDQARLDMTVARVQAEYELDHKERDNADLRRINAEQERIITGRRTRDLIMVVLLCSLAALVAALLITGRYAWRLARRVKLRNMLIRKQQDQIRAMDLEVQRGNLRLAEALMNEEQKEITLKEIHHRVKNNLQVVDSLLTAQGIHVADPNVERLFREAQGRIRSMAMVHEHIYRSGGQTQGPLQNYLAQLARNVIVAYGVHDHVSVTVDARIPMFVESTLMPLSLLINELVTNSVKYAFQGRDAGHIHITVRPAGAEHELIYTDNGIGQESSKANRGRSFGLELIQAIAGQLNGEVRTLKGSGTGFKLTFSAEGKALRIAS